MNELPVTLKTFQECLDIARTSGGNNHLMLGNGFSVELFPHIFNYKALAERITSEQIKNLFKKIKTNDFEFVMHKMTDALQIAKIYPEGKQFAQTLEKDLDELKNTLIDVITLSHPANPGVIAEEQYNYCYQFLKNFDSGKKYSFNYDLLLYWVYMHFVFNKDEKLKCDDGFRHPEDDQSIVTWAIGMEREQNLYYLHGAMHIFSDGANIEKYTWINSGKTITKQVEEAISVGKYPVFISEGTKAHKLSRIQENSYLGRGFSSMKAISGNLFIFGHSLRDEDDHVFDFILSKSNVKNVFISIFGEIETENNQKIVTKVSRWKLKFSKKEFHYYCSKSANVWGKSN